MKVEFELSNAVFEKWLKYKKKSGFSHDSSALHNLLEKTISDKDLLDALYESASCVIPSEILTETQKDIFNNIRYFFCGCEVCETAGGHADKKSWEIGISRKHFDTMLRSGFPVPIGILSVIGTFVHEITHIIYPNLDENGVIEKTARLWTEGMQRIAHEIKGL